MQKHILALLFLVTFWVPPSAEATTYSFPQFGKPIIAGDRLVFSGPATFPGISPLRLICIDPRGGKKLWDIANGTNSIRPYFLLNDKLLVTVGSDIHACDAKTGTLQLVYKPGYENSRLFQQSPGIILVCGDRREVDYLSYVDSSKWTKIWETPRLSYVLAEGHGCAALQIRDPPARQRRWIHNYK